MSERRTEYSRMVADGPQSIRANIIFLGLRPFSFLYGLVMRVRSRLYLVGLKSSYRASVPVISVGNLTTGGTGKTPMVDFLAKDVRARGLKCAIVSRGYGGKYSQAVGRVTDTEGKLCMTPQECGDEPYLLAIRNQDVPVYVARKRILGVQAAEQDGAQIVLLDDGFQHQAVQRDLDIVLLDAKKPFGNGRLLPAGMLREPLSALQRADLIIMTRSDATQGGSIHATCPVMHSRHQLDKIIMTLDGEQLSTKDYVGKSCLAFAGIAKPEGFFVALREFGFSRIEEIPLSDHQEYNQGILNRLIKSCDNHDLIITTEKDAVKLSSVTFPKPCCQVGVKLVFDDITPLTKMLDEIVERCR